MKTSKLLLLVLTLGLIMGLSGGLQAAPQYRYYTTGQGPGSAEQGDRLAINDNNQAVVNFNDRAYLWTLKGGLTDLGDLGGGKSYGHAINNQGQIVGESYIDSTTSHAFLWQSGQITDLGLLSGGVRSTSDSINNLGQVVGRRFDASNNMSTWTWTQTGGLQPLDLQGGIPFSLSDDGRIVGQKNNHAWLWNTPGAGQDLSTNLPAPYTGDSEAHGINQNGQVVLWAMQLNPPYGGASRAFSWTQAGGIKDLGTLGGTDSRAYSINKAGYIVGWSQCSIDGPDAPCLWTPSGGILNLNTLVIDKPPGVTMGDAEAINNHGVIMGQELNGYDLEAAYMLVPTQTSPGGLLLLLE